MEDVLRRTRATTEKEDDRNARFRPHSQFPISLVPAILSTVWATWNRDVLSILQRWTGEAAACWLLSACLIGAAGMPRRQSSRRVMCPAAVGARKHRAVSLQGSCRSSSTLLSWEFAPFLSPTPTLSAGDSVVNRVPAPCESLRFAPIPIR